MKWVDEFDVQTNSADTSVDIAVDMNGNLYVIGTSSIDSISGHIVLIIYDSLGQKQWVKLYGESNGYIDVPTAIVVDDLGNAYISGYKYVLGDPSDWITMKLDSSGTVLWSKEYSTTGEDKALAIDIDDSGNVYVLGFVWGGDSNRPDYRIVKFDDTGQVKWQAQYNGKGNDEVGAILVTIDGQCYVSGVSQVNESSTVYHTIKYGSDGMEEWARSYSLLNSLKDEVFHLQEDGSGSVYLSGRSLATASTLQYLVIKYSESGNLEWNYSRQTSRISYTDPHAFGVDFSGNSYISVPESGGITKIDFATSRFKSQGISDWSVDYDGTINQDDWPISLLLVNFSDLYVTGYSMDNGKKYITTLIYNSNGVEQALYRYESEVVRANTVPAGMARTNDGCLYVVANVQDLIGGGTPHFATLIKYSPIPTNIENEDLETPVEYSLSHNFPNPFHPSTRISFFVPASCNVQISIYNILGKELICFWTK